MRVLKDVQPHAFLLENVPVLITTDGGNALRKIVADLEGVGYIVKHQFFSSRGMTIQSRKRMYIFGIHINTGIHKGNDDVNDNGIGIVVSREFQFPFMPDLSLVARYVFHSKQEL